MSPVVLVSRVLRRFRLFGAHCLRAHVNYTLEIYYSLQRLSNVSSIDATSGFNEMCNAKSVVRR